MAIGFPTPNTAVFTTIDIDEVQQSLHIHVSEDIPLLHADYESLTFIVDRLQLDDEEFYTVREDLLAIDGLPVPFGQFFFLVYEGDGEFFAWSNSHECSTGKVCIAFKKFGYTASVDSPVSYHVDEKSTFTLKLKHGY
jgi:hypothetical protein